MRPEQIMQELQHVKDEYLLDAKAPVSRKKHLSKWGVILAACLCVVLAMGVAAAGVMGLISVHSYTRGDGKVVSYYEKERTVHTIPLERFSEEALAFAASQMSLPAIRVCESWDEAEEFLGLEVADISAPHGLAPTEMSVQLGGRSEVTYHCAVSFVGRCDAPTFVDLYAAYKLNGVWIGVEATIATDQSQMREGSEIRTFLGDSSAEVISWITPHGLEATVVKYPDNEMYIGEFILNGIYFRFTAFGKMKPEKALSAMVELMDSFK